MGEARRKRLAREALGDVPVPRPEQCPACGGRHVLYLQPGELPDVRVEIGACVDCRAIWEALPPMYFPDEVCAEPCDNCAFRPGSPEQQNKEKWKELLASLDPRGAPDGWPFAGRFYCHKHVPIDQASGPGNFLFPEREFQFEGQTVKTHDTSRMRTCTGFLRMVWSINGVARERNNGTSK